MGPNQVFGGWTLSSNIFWRSGLPFSIVDSGVLAGLEAPKLRYDGNRDSGFCYNPRHPVKLQSKRGEYTVFGCFAIRLRQFLRNAGT